MNNPTHAEVILEKLDSYVRVRDTAQRRGEEGTVALAEFIIYELNQYLLDGEEDHVLAAARVSAFTRRRLEGEQ